MDIQDQHSQSYNLLTNQFHQINNREVISEQNQINIDISDDQKSDKKVKKKSKNIKLRKASQNIVMSTQQNIILTSVKTKKSQEDKHHLLITDVGMHFDDIDLKDPMLTKKKEKNLLKRLFYQYDLYIMLVMIAVLTPIVGSSFVYITKICQDFIFNQYLLSQNTDRKIIGIVICFILLILAIFITNRYPNTEGSGIPELKSVLAGVSIYRYLSLRILLSKIAGLILATQCGLFIGKEGPFVHIGASIANNLTKIPIFRRLHQKNTFRKQLLAVAAGIGITSTFGTPIGGALYSIEVMGTIFQVSNFWKTIFTSCICGLVLNTFYKLFGVLNYPITQFPTNINYYSPKELFPFFLLGLIAAIIGIIQIKFTTQFILFRKYIVSKNVFLGRYIYSMIALTLNLLVVLLFSNFCLFQEHAIHDLFNDVDNSHFFDEIHLNYLEFAFLLVMRLVLVAISTTSAVPSGLFVPLFILGGMLGRLMHPFAKDMLGSSLPSNAFAVVGSACLVSSATHTVAIIVIVFELTNNIQLLYPCMVGVLTTYITSKFFTISIYYVIVDIKNLDFLPKLLKATMYNKQAHQIMNADIPLLYPSSTINQIKEVLVAVEYKIMAIPIVDDDNPTNLIASVQTANLIDYLNREYKKFVNNSNLDSKQLKLTLNNQSTKTLYEDQARHFHYLVNDKNKIAQQDMREILELPNHSPFWDQQFDINHERLNLNNTPFIVQYNTNVAQVHFLFAMLGLQQVFVVNQGILVGTINAQDFIEKQ